MPLTGKALTKSMVLRISANPSPGKPTITWAQTSIPRFAALPQASANSAAVWPLFILSSVESLAD